MIVSSAAYAAGCKVADIPLDELGAWAKREGHFVWVGLFEPSDAEIGTVQAQLGLHDLAVEDAHRAYQRPKLEEYGESLFVVLRTMRWNPEKRTIDRGETHVFVGPGAVVSIRHGDTGSYSEVRGRCEATPGHLAKGPGFVLYALMDHVVDSYFPVIEHIEDRVAKLEKAIFGEHPQRNTTQRIYELKRRLIQAKRAVSPLVDICNRLTRWDGHQLIPDEVRSDFVGYELVAVPAGQPVADVDQRRHRAFRLDQAALQLVDALGGVALRVLAEDRFLELRHPILDMLDHGEVAVHHVVHQGVEDEPGSLGEMAGGGLAAPAHLAVGTRVAVPDRHHGAGPHEDVRLPAVDRAFLGVPSHRSQHDEEALTVLLELRPLVRPMGVLDCQVVQAELRLYGADLRI